MRKPTVLVTAALACGLAFAPATPMLAAPALAAQATAPAAAVRPAGQPGLTADLSVVRAGNTLHLDLDHGQEAVSWISSPAFVRDAEHPMGADEGVARIVGDHDGHASAVATIADVPPGVYEVHTRVGGGVGPSTTITVVE
ncbi:hypothetical protein A8924_0129 [Saccharopolyspora erythraea NRRL 2338]|uniref:Uncharacterized protein n=2 Tax=Saccharopolyspora erythraea TaxID=1836 RepID=A4FQH8_SACEN|nr:hypothetical protein [Saccharopolyspora erythraea]EQD86608.1 hypothetical protein N599_08505 [Saccharopolyspora erythraea D]PFG92905.1 hypothetical protein A8924_0129 [Saccharopolyspora erythraea NRRL 2338]QRK89807.1 hypothetical protein JQX30_35785 [Saccharopolyspora erythraea]CAM06303.1 hypothetical protein SACE_7145 [Saccharopolyspora erythraea NRRL 2338]